MVFTFMNVHLGLKEYYAHLYLSLKKTSDKFHMISLYTRGIRTGLVMVLLRVVHVL